MLDENNKLVSLSSLIRPIVIYNPEIQTAKDAAIAVSRIPYDFNIVARSEKTLALMKQHLSSIDEEKAIKWDANTGIQISKCLLRNSPHLLATDNYFAQVASPQTMILKKCGSLLEHAILLCGLLLGKGINSFVALGTSKY